MFARSAAAAAFGRSSSSRLPSLLSQRGPPRPLITKSFRRQPYSSSSSFFPSSSAFSSGERALLGVIGVNLAVAMDWNFGWPLTLNQMHKHFLASTYCIFSPQSHLYLHTLFTSTVSHIEPWHLFANMITLYFFASDVFNRFGPKFGLTLYLVAGGLSTLGALAHAKYVDHRPYRVLGASGAVCSFVTLNILLNPKQIVLVWFVVPVPAALFGIGYILKEFWSANLPLGMTQESHVAHLTGSAVGLLAWTAVRRGVRV